MPARPITTCEVLRRQQGLTQARLGAQAGLSQALVSQVETGQSVSTDALARLKEALSYDGSVEQLNQPFPLKQPTGD